MQTQTAIKLAGNATALAEILSISLSAISQWGDELPELRLYKLKEIKPEWFDGQAAAETVPTVITGELPVPRTQLVEAIKAGLIKDPRQVIRRAVDRKA